MANIAVYDLKTDTELTDEAKLDPSYSKDTKAELKTAIAKTDRHTKINLGKEVRIRIGTPLGYPIPGGGTRFAVGLTRTDSGYELPMTSVHGTQWAEDKHQFLLVNVESSVMPGVNSSMAEDGYEIPEIRPSLDPGL